MNRADRRATARGQRRPGATVLARKLERGDTDMPVLQLLVERGTILHAGIARGPGPGTPLCEKVPSLFQHPIFARDPNFSPGLSPDLRHSYAIAAMQLNDGCAECQRQLVAAGYMEYPFLDPVKAEPL